MLIEILDGINGIKSLEEIQEVLRVVKQKAEVISNRSFLPDQQVQLLPEFQGRKPYDAIGTIIKINPKRLKVNFGIYGSWTVIKTMVKKVG